MTFPRLGDLTADYELRARADALIKMACAEALSHDLDSALAEFAARGGRQFIVGHKAGVSPLAQDDIDLSRSRRAMAELADRQSVIGRLVGAIRVAPVVVAREVISNPSVGWVGLAGDRTPVSTMTFDSADLAGLPIAGLVVASETLVRRRDVQAEGLIRRALLAVLNKGLDNALLDPASTAIADTRPASITAGLSAIVTDASVAKAAGAALHAISDGAPSNPHLILSFRSALSSPGLLQDLERAGVNTIISPAAGVRVIAVDAARVTIAAGDVEIDSSRAADIELDDSPGSGALTSMYSTNHIAFRARRFANWKAAAGSVAYSTIAS